MACRVVDSFAFMLLGVEHVGRYTISEMPGHQRRSLARFQVTCQRLPARGLSAVVLHTRHPIAS